MPHHRFFPNFHLSLPTPFSLFLFSGGVFFLISARSSPPQKKKTKPILRAEKRKEKKRVRVREIYIHTQGLVSMVASFVWKMSKAALEGGPGKPEKHLGSSKAQKEPQLTASYLVTAAYDI